MKTRLRFLYQVGHTLTVERKVHALLEKLSEAEAQPQAAARKTQHQRLTVLAEHVHDGSRRSWTVEVHTTTLEHQGGLLPDESLAPAVQLRIGELGELYNHAGELVSPALLPEHEVEVGFCWEVQDFAYRVESLERVGASENHQGHLEVTFVCAQRIAGSDEQGPFAIEVQGATVFDATHGRQLRADSSHQMEHQVGTRLTTVTQERLLESR